MRKCPMHPNKSSTRSSITSVFFTSLCVLSLSACVSTRDYTAPDAPKGSSQTHLIDLGNQRFQAAQPVITWWKTLEDAQLNALITQALDSNKDIAVALTNVLEARAVARSSGYDRYPTVTSNATYQRIRASEANIPPTASRTSDHYELGFDAAWELDLFGRVSAKIKGSQAREQAAVAGLNNAYVTIAAEVARGYVELRGAQYRLNIAKRNAKNQQNTYELTKQLTEGGRGTQLDVSRALTQLELTQSTIPGLEAEVTAQINRLSVLTGQVPDALRQALSQTAPLPSIPVSIHVGNVSDLLKRRPDIAAAEYQLTAATADYNVAVANQFPIVNIIGSLGFIATRFSDFGASTLASTVGPSVNWAAFDMGRVKASIAQNDARAKRAVITYEKTVLEALEELQTAISHFSKEEERRKLLQQAAISSQKSAQLARQRYEAGIDTFIDVLSAEATLLEAEDRLAQSEINALFNLVSIYKALGGGWQVKQ